jgi:hypothetical protein
LTELRVKAQAIFQEKGWHLLYALFARGGFSAPLIEQAGREGVLLVNLPDLVE